MRYGVFIVLICSAFSMSSQSVPKNLIGKWTWIETSGGFAGEITNPKTEKYEVQIEFTKNKLFSEWKDKQTINCQKYVIKSGKSIYSEQAQPIITYVPKPGNKISLMADSFEFKGKDTLILKNECHDCYTRVFVRKK